MPLYWWIDWLTLYKMLKVHHEFALQLFHHSKEVWALICCLSFCIIKYASIAIFTWITTCVVIIFLRHTFPSEFCKHYSIVFWHFIFPWRHLFPARFIPFINSWIPDGFFLYPWNSITLPECHEIGYCNKFLRTVCL